MSIAPQYIKRIPTYRRSWSQVIGTRIPQENLDAIIRDISILTEENRKSLATKARYNKKERESRWNTNVEFYSRIFSSLLEIVFWYAELSRIVTSRRKLAMGNIRTRIYLQILQPSPTLCERIEKTDVGDSEHREAPRGSYAKPLGLASVNENKQEIHNLWIEVRKLWNFCRRISRKSRSESIKDSLFFLYRFG